MALFTSSLGRDPWTPPFESPKHTLPSAAALDRLVGWHLAVRLDAVLEAEELPASIADLHAALPAALIASADCETKLTSPNPTVSLLMLMVTHPTHPELNHYPFVNPRNPLPNP